jgi:plastocyanin
MRVRRAFQSVLCLLASALAWAGAVRPAPAAELTVEVADARGRPVPDALILLHPASASASAQPPPPQTRVIDQRDETFVPYVESFRPGDHVVFSNSDATRHHVYSFSPLKRFEFVLAPGERSPPQPLEAEGAIAVGCNIHDRMLTYLYVSAAPWQARTDAAGQARIEALPSGEYRLSVWHPQLRGAAPAPRAVVLDSERARQHSSFALRLAPDPRGAPDPERGDY